MKTFLVAAKVKPSRFVARSTVARRFSRQSGRRPTRSVARASSGEANAYDTFRVEGVPHLIESNAHRHKDAEIVPYIAIDFIMGPTLHKWREEQIVSISASPS